SIQLNSEDNRILNGHITSRFFFCFLTMILLYRFCRNFVSVKLSIISMFVFQAFLPLTTMYFGWETFIGTTFFLGGLICIIEKRSLFLLLLITLFGSTARADHMVFISIIYFLFHFKSSMKKNQKVRIFLNSTISFSIPVISILIISLFLYPEANYVTDIIQLNYNIKYIWSWIYPLIFLTLPIIFYKGIMNYDFFKKSWYWIIPFIIMNFSMAKTVEVRIFLPAIVYSMPFIMTELFSILTKINIKSPTER
ncbi:MAG: hypothetical protein ACOC80_10405, partial [Petrotogales bacterium]